MLRFVGFVAMISLNAKNFIVFRPPYITKTNAGEKGRLYCFNPPLKEGLRSLKKQLLRFCVQKLITDSMSNMIDCLSKFLG